MIARVVTRERFSCRRSGIGSMSAEERLLALEQLVTVMQGEVISAAETRVLGVRGEGVVDTRLLGNPKSFDESTDSSSSRSWAALAQSTQDSNKR